MIKLYKKSPDGSLSYHEAWIGDDCVEEHWGVIGTTGDHQEHPYDRSSSDEKNVARILKPARKRGFAEIPLEEHRILLIEYVVDGAGQPADVDKRHRLEDRMNELLGWTGLGFCDGGSIGSGTMEACCFVVDFPLAKSVIEKDLIDSEFADHSRIYDEAEDSGPIDG